MPRALPFLSLLRALFKVTLVKGRQTLSSCFLDSLVVLPIFETVGKEGEEDDVLQVLEDLELLRSGEACGGDLLPLKTLPHFSSTTL